MPKWIRTKDKLPKEGKIVIVLKSKRPAQYPPDILYACVLNTNKCFDWEFDFKPLPPLDKDVAGVNGSHWFYMPPICRWNKTADKLPVRGKPTALLTVEEAQPWPNEENACFIYTGRLRDKNDKDDAFKDCQFASYGYEYGAAHYRRATHWIYLPAEPERDSDETC